MLGDGRTRVNRSGIPLGLFLSVIVVLAVVGAVVVVRALVEWLT